MVEANLTELDNAATDLSEIACDLGGTDLLAPLEPVATALSSADTTSAVLEVGMRLAAAVKIFAERVDEMSRAASACAQNYRECDENVGADFRAIATP